MTAKRWEIIDEEFISYTGGTAQLISNGECEIHLWERPKDAQLFCDKLNALNDENEQLKFERDRYNRLSEIRQESINNRILTIKEFIDNCSDKKVKKTLEQLFHSEVNEYDLSKKIRKLEKENEELKEDNDIKFWKHELMIQWNKTQIISHELSLAIENGYEISEDFKKYLDELKERHEENMKKAERLKI